MDAENRPKAALINKEWFDAARSIMSVQDLGIVIVRACEYVFGSETFDIGGETQKVVFAMIKPALDSDIAKYHERCARNAANARSGRERVAASGTQSQPVEATSTSTSNSSICDDERRVRERFEIYGYFWSIGSNSALEELDAFWDYYESLGWKNNKGAVIVSKIAAARMWRRQFDTKTPPDGAQQWYKAVKECTIPNPRVFTTFMGAERDGDKIKVRLACSEKYFAQIRENTPRLEADLRAVWRGLEPVFETAG